MIRYFQPRCMPESYAPFTQVVIDDTYAHLAGIVAADFPEGQSVLGDANNETLAVMTLIENILGELNLGFSQVVRIDVHLASLDDFDAMDAAYREFFESGKYRPQKVRRWYSWRHPWDVLCWLRHGWRGRG